jgi:nitroimidazol reductase NimA-like FMN-containing flavoprotein (pyridoxamine 5'-phosphate oxidase superfamily)
MFREMRRSDKKLSDSEMLEILASAEYGILSTMGEDGFPYGVPVNFIYKDNRIYFHAAMTGHKLDNFAYNDKVSFCVVTDVALLPSAFSTKFKSVIAFGTVKEVAESEKNEIYLLFLEKLSKDFVEAGKEYINKAGANAKVFQIDVLHMTAKGKK